MMKDYKVDLAHAMADFVSDGGSATQWRDMMAMTAITLKDCGFKDGAEVRRVAEKCGRFA